MPVQWVNRPNLDFRGFSGLDRERTRSSPDEEVRVVPSGKTSTIKSIVTLGGDLDQRGRGPVGHAHPCRRDRLQPRRRDRDRRRSAAGRRPVRSLGGVDERRGADRRARLLAQACDPDRHRDGRRAQIRDQHQHDGAPRGQDAELNFDRGRRGDHRPADRVRTATRIRARSAASSSSTSSPTPRSPPG